MGRDVDYDTMGWHIYDGIDYGTGWDRMEWDGKTMVIGMGWNEELWDRMP